MKLIIEPADNGIILTSKSIEESIPDRVFVFEDNEINKKHIAHLLWQVIEELGEVGSKHDEERVRIIRVNREGEEIVN